MPPSSTCKNYNVFAAFIVPALCMIVIPPLSTCRKGKRHHIKIAGTLLCLTILTVTLLQSMPAKASQTKAAVIWGSESTGAYDPRIGQSWRKHSTEIQCQRYISNTLANFFSSNGYAAYNHQGYPRFTKKQHPLHAFKPAEQFRSCSSNSIRSRSRQRQILAKNRIKESS